MLKGLLKYKEEDLEIDLIMYLKQFGKYEYKVYLELNLGTKNTDINRYKQVYHALMDGESANIYKETLKEDKSKYIEAKEKIVNMMYKTLKKSEKEKVGLDNSYEYIKNLENKTERQGVLLQKYNQALASIENIDNELNTLTEKRLMAEVVGDNWRRIDITKRGCTTNVQNSLLAKRLTSLIKCVTETGKYEGCIYTVLSATGETIGTYKRYQGEITELQVKTKDIELDLKSCTEKDVQKPLYFKLEELDKFKRVVSKTPCIALSVKIDKQYLGFEPNAITNSNEEELGTLKNSNSQNDLYETFDEVIKAHPDKNFIWLKNCKYEIVTDDTLEDTMQEFYRAGKRGELIAIDTETTGTNINFLSREGRGDQLVGICLSKEVGTGYYFPLQMKHMQNLCNGNHKYFMETYMKDFLETCDFVVHNAAFDWKVFYIYDINLHYVMDTMIAFAVTLRYRRGKTFEYNLKALTKNIFDLDQLSLHHFSKVGVWGYQDEYGNTSDFSDLPYDFVKYYACADADCTLRLAHYCLAPYEPSPDEEGGKNPKGIPLIDFYGANAVYKIELDFARALAYSEFYGLHINVEDLPKLTEEYKKGREKCLQELIQMARELGDTEFDNPASPKQLQHIMYDILKIPEYENKRTTNKTYLKDLAERINTNGELQYPFCAKILEYRSYDTTWKNFINKQNEYITKDGYVFAHVFAFGTDTGRCSVKEPNYQSYNDLVKKYVTPRGNNKQWDSDFSQIEYRVLCSLAGQENLKEAFKDPDMDYHQLQASNLYQVPYALVTKEMRSVCKKFNFGLPYGMSIKTLAKALGIEVAEAQKLYNLYFKGQEKILDFFNRVRDEGEYKHYTSTYFNRRRYYDTSKYSGADIRRQAGNHCVQGTAADIWKMAVNNVMNSIIEHGWMGKVLLNAFVHDEILGEISPEVNFYEFVEVWRKSFEIELEGFCKLYAGLGIGNSWYEAKKQDLSPQFITELINNPKRNTWDGNGDRFCKELKEDYYNFGIRRVREYIQLDEAQGEVIKPAINLLLKEKTTDYLKDIKNNVELKSKYEKLGVNFNNEKKFTENLQVWLQIFCEWQNIDYTKIDIKDVADVELDNEDNKQGHTEQEIKEILENQELEVEKEREKTYSITLLQLQTILDVGCAVIGDKFYLNLNKLSKDKGLVKALFNQTLYNARGYKIYFISEVNDKDDIIKLRLNGQLLEDWLHMIEIISFENKNYVLSSIPFSVPIKYMGDLKPLVTLKMQNLQ